jgi:hypothetical protein
MVAFFFENAAHFILPFADEWHEASAEDQRPEH